MIVDSSAIMAILRQESDAAAFAEMLSAAGSLSMSAGTWIELTAVTTRGAFPDAFERSNELMAEAEITVLPVTVEQAEIARQAYRRYGLGTAHEARLNYGDCFSYALAKSSGEPLLFKGDDFSKTDVARAL